MRKIKVNFHMGRLLGGGIETTLLTYLKNIDRENFEITLTVGWRMSQLDSFTKFIPCDIKVNYLVESALLTSMKIKKIITGKLSLFDKIMENMVFVPIGRYLYAKNFMVQSKEYDVIVDFGLSLPMGVLKIKTPIISFLHFDLYAYTGKIQRKISRLGSKFQKVSNVVVLNNEMMAQCLSEYPLIAEKFIKLYNLFDTEYIIERANQYSSELWSSDYILTVCRLEETSKDVASIIFAYKMVKEQYGYLGKLLIVGDGNSKYNLTQLVVKLNLVDDILFLGYQVNPFKYMRCAKIFILSSRFEGFGNVLVEAMVVNVPILSTDCPVGPREILLDGQAGLLVPVGDVEAIADGINQILTDSCTVRRLKENMLARVEDFSINKNIYQFYNILTSAIKQSNFTNKT